MDERTKAGWSKVAKTLLLLLSCVILAGCGLFPKKPEQFRPKSETEIAVEQIKDEWLAPCEVLGPPPDNSVGNLVQDFADLSSLAAKCFARQLSLVDYLKPVVKKERSK